MELEKRISDFLNANWRLDLSEEEGRLWKAEYKRLGKIYATWGAIFAIFGAPTVLFYEINHEFDHPDQWLFFRLFPSAVILLGLLLFKWFKFSHEVMFLIIAYSLFIDYAYWPDCANSDFFLYGQMTLLIPSAVITLLRPFFFVINFFIQFALISIFFVHFCDQPLSVFFSSKEFIPILIASISSYLVATFRYLIIKRNFVFNLLLKEALDEAKEEREKSDKLLKNILPEEVADELKHKGASEAKNFDMVSILFTDFKQFTEISETMSAKELVREIDVCFTAFDRICEEYNVEKIKTLGDAYMAAGGLPVPSEQATVNTVLAALKMSEYIIRRNIERQMEGEKSFEMRCGIHTGAVVAGIVGLQKFQYDIWGDTVNTASRMESKGIVGKVNLSESTYTLIKDDPRFKFEQREPIHVKGKGDMVMYLVEFSEDYNS